MDRSRRSTDAHQVKTGGRASLRNGGRGHVGLSRRGAASGGDEAQASRLRTGPERDAVEEVEEGIAARRCQSIGGRGACSSRIHPGAVSITAACPRPFLRALGGAITDAIPGDDLRLAGKDAANTRAWRIASPAISVARRRGAAIRQPRSRAVRSRAFRSGSICAALRSWKPRVRPITTPSKEKNRAIPVPGGPFAASSRASRSATKTR